MHKLWNIVTKLYLRLTGSIAFWPGIISLVFLAIAIIVLSYDNEGLNGFLVEHLSQLAVQKADNARLVLGTLAGGTVSLTVFSFTMVMIVLNQAGSNLSPRVIPGLITKRAHQIVLGFYLGTTIYILLLILGFENRERDLQISMGGILLAVIFGIICLVLFVYFIHSISRSVQVDSILNDVYRQGLVGYAQHETTPIPYPFEKQDVRSEILVIDSTRAGYLAVINTRELMALACQHNLELCLMTYIGDFVQQGQVLLKVANRSSCDNDLREKLLHTFTFTSYDVTINNSETSLKQISEIAVRALSPGINDPGTAKKAIDLLTSLLVLQLKVPAYKVYNDEKQIPRIAAPHKPFGLMLQKYLLPIRHYGRDNVNINLKLLYSLQVLLDNDKAQQHQKVLHKELNALQQSYTEYISPAEDQETISNAAKDTEQLSLVNTRGTAELPDS